MDDIQTDLTTSRRKDWSECIMVSAMFQASVYDFIKIV